MNFISKSLVLGALCCAIPSMAVAYTPQDDPDGVVEKWTDTATKPKIIDINFSDTHWPDTWTIQKTGMYLPEWEDGAYVNAKLEAATSTADVTYPVLFHNVAFANKESYGGYAGATAAFCRQFYEGSKATNQNDWTEAGHTVMLEDNIRYDADNRPVYGEAGFAQMCRGASVDGVTSLHGWVEIDHIPYVERVQWAWSNTSWGRGIKCDIKIGDGDWKPLVWMGSEKHKMGYTIYSDQGYFMDNIIDAYDVSIRWRIWDGDGPQNGSQVQSAPFSWQSIDPLAQRQGARLHKVRIFGNEISEDEAAFARENPVGDPGELTDLSKFGGGADNGHDPAQDAGAETKLIYVNPDGSGDFTSIQKAVNSVAAGTRGIIYVAPGVYDEHVYVGSKEMRNRFVSLIALDPEKTILTSSVDRGTSGDYLDCAALKVFSHCFYAEGLTIRNTSGNVGQAEALFTCGDAHIFNKCIITGAQDTYKSNVASRGYFRDCTIAGNTDFIYDGGLEWFERCKILCIAPTGYITAPAESSFTMTGALYPELSVSPFYAGLFFNDCDIVAGEGVADGAFYLGRPWKEGCGAMFMRSRLGSHINAKGWKEWSGTEAKSCLMEYKNVDAEGKLVDTSKRASFSHQASDAEVEAYINPDFLFHKMSNVDFDFDGILKGCSAPRNFVETQSGVYWDEVDGAAGYLVTLAGEYVDMVAEPHVSVSADVDVDKLEVRSISRRGVLSVPSQVSSSRKLLAFPTAEGFGKFATGGRGGKVVKVTSLADDGSEGTLRWAFAQHPGEPITIVFDVCGRIALKTEMRINRANWTLAGQSAPGDGIVITNAKVNLGGSQNFIVRNVRFRIGHLDASGNVQPENALGAENCANFIFDHCSFGWSVEENMNTADSHFLTVQHSIVHEGLYDAGHSKGPRGYGSQWGGSPATYHHNLLAHNNSRSARLNGARGEDYVVFLEYINNVNYNYGSSGGCYGGENTAAITSYNGLNSAHDCNFIANYYKPGPYSSKSKVCFINASYAREGATSWAPAQFYIADNYAEGFASANSDNWSAVSAESYSNSQIKAAERIVTATPYYKYTPATPEGLYVPEEYMLFDIETAQDAFNTVVATAGPVKRDKVEKRIAAEVKAGNATYGGVKGATSGIIDKEEQAEGFFDYDVVSPSKDSDGDGMPDEWETLNGLNPAEADNNLVNHAGYTALEVYLNSLMGEAMDVDFSSLDTIIPDIDITVTYDAASQCLVVPAEAIGATLKVYAVNGYLLHACRITETMVDLSSLPAGILLASVEGQSIATKVLKIKK